MADIATKSDNILQGIMSKEAFDKIQKSSDYSELLKALKNPKDMVLSKYLPMKCQGILCPVFGSCPIQSTLGQEYVPQGEPCPIEIHLLKMFAEELRRGVMDQVGEDNYDGLMQTLVDELVEIHILEIRTSGDIANNGYISEVPVVISGTGGQREIMFKKELSPTLEVKLQLKERKRQILNALLATPETKARFSKKNRSDDKTLASELARIAEKKVILDVMGEKLKGIEDGITEE